MIKLSTTLKRFQHEQNDFPLIGGKTLEDRNTLGQTFGTRKKKITIKQKQDNKIQMSAVMNVAGAIQDTILKNIESIPSRQELKETAMNVKMIPQHNVDATTPDGVYLVDSLVSEEEFKLIPVDEVCALEFQADLKVWLEQIQ